MRIIIDDLSGSGVIGLLSEHHAEMHQHSPPESVHALDENALKDPAITFWSAWIDDEIAGCGAIKQLSPLHGEIKSMRTAQRHRRQGVAEQILKVILKSAASRGYQRVSLETGTPAAFDAAKSLYRKYGFEECEPFGDYTLDPFSTFMTKSLRMN